MRGGCCLCGPMMISAKRLLSNKKRVGGYPFWGEFRRYATDGRRIVKVGMGFSIEKRALTDYQIVEDEVFGHA